MTNSRTTRPPIIILGMHRSGTSMICRMLEQLGLFVGEQKDANNEAMFFLELNGWLLRQAGARWDIPEPFDYLLEFDQERELAVDYLRYLLRTPRLGSYIGWQRYLREPTPSSWDFPWGWKDPRNTFTLPLWLEVFPEARMVHIHRHGVDVARSLQTRRDKKFAAGRATYERMRGKFAPIYWLRQKQSGFGGSLRCASLEGGFSLWEAYMHRAQQNLAGLDDRAIEIQYEDFLAEPAQQLERLCEFCSLDASAQDIRGVASNVRAGRAFAFTDDADAVAFADGVRERLDAFGYGASH
ncbi:sulfotransferase [Persicimonas caeni]|uniref:Sulfotransferase n=1 Tax=Persicimonas caeni TaxID=2292766 RepID=A0A4Y6PTR0_PERCE|nr:sulfotransferase [Persicimonas caeni]QDG51688.1 sulfotransferase [Persicimonas caeni]QED32909.1 sulfotransferase [Persicimonas caeni]